MPVHVAFPPPSNGQDFERLILALAPSLYDAKSIDVDKWGTNGEKQDGVDVYLVTRDGEHIGLQCKLREKLTKTMITDEVTRSKGFPVPLNRFVIVTSLKPSTRLQDHVVALDADDTRTIRIVFWDEINDVLNNNPPEAIDYLRTTLIPLSDLDLEKQHLAELRDLMDRPALRRNVHEEQSFVDQREAIKLIATFLRTGHIYDHHRTFLAHPIRLRDLPDEYRDRLTLLLRRIDTLYATIDAYLSNTTVEKQNHVENARSKVINEINKQLAHFRREWALDNTHHKYADIPL